MNLFEYLLYINEKNTLQLRELNLKKYNKNTPQEKPFVIQSSLPNRSQSDNSLKNKTFNGVKNNFHVNGTTKRPISATLPNKTAVSKDLNMKPKPSHMVRKDVPPKNYVVSNKTINQVKKATSIPKIAEKKNEIVNKTEKNGTVPSTSRVEPPKNQSRKSFAPKTSASLPKTSVPPSRKSFMPQRPDSKHEKDSKPNGNRESVFERLYKPKLAAKKQPDEVTKLQTDPNYLKKVLKDSGLILNKRHTVFNIKPKVDPPVRRSISAVHFKRISKNEMNNCIHKWSSIGEKLDRVHLKNINEDENVKGDKVVSAIKSERKKVTFQASVPMNFNTPRPEELQAKLKSWLQKRGKSLDSYHHLQCFGIHHITQKLKPMEDVPKFELYDDEDKENIAVEHDSDNDSYTENMNEEMEDLANDNGGFDSARFV